MQSLVGECLVAAVCLVPPAPFAPPIRFERWELTVAVSSPREDLAERAVWKPESCADEWMAGAMVGGLLGAIVGPLLAGHYDPSYSHPRISIQLAAGGGAAVGAILGAMVASEGRKDCPD